MTISSSKYLRKKAEKRIESGEEPRNVVLFYAAFCAAAAFAAYVLQYLLEMQIAKTGGLQNIGLRSALSTANTLAPMVSNLIIMCLNLGYLAAMLRIARHQYASPKTLKAGFERFWPLLRSMLIRTALYVGCAIVAYYLAVFTFSLSPLSRNFSRLVLESADADTIDPIAMLQDEAFLTAMIPTLRPMFIIYIVLLIVLVFPVYYRYRFTEYVLIDQPQGGALYAMHISRMLMRGNTLALFKIDLAFWWFHLLNFTVMVIPFADLLLPMAGVILPENQAVIFFGKIILYLAADFAITYLFQNQYAVTLALAYDSLVPKQESNGVVLGNIFQM